MGKRQSRKLRQQHRTLTRLRRELRKRLRKRMGRGRKLIKKNGRMCAY